MSFDEYAMREALKQAIQAAEADEVPIGAVVTYGERIIARGQNRVERLQDPTAHAEMLAITAAVEALGAKYLKGCTLYVTLEPCVMCMGALRWAQLERIVFAAYDPKGGYQTLAPLAPHPKAKIEGGLLAEEATALLKNFFKNKR